MSPRRNAREIFSSHLSTRSRKPSSKTGTKSAKTSSELNSKPRKLSSQLHTKVAGFKVPPDVKILDSLSEFAGITNINDLPQDCLGSGSDVTQRQFLALRIIFEQMKFNEIEHSSYWSEWDLTRLLIEAARRVGNCPEFQAYLELISTRTSVSTIGKGSPKWPGSLKPVKAFHEQILRKKNQEGTLSESTSMDLRSRSRPPKVVEVDIDDSDEISEAEGRPASHDSDKTYVDPSENLVAVKEPTPNAALIVLLQATCDLVSDVPWEWTLDPVYFHSRFRGGDFNVYTDGALRSTTDKSVLSIVEVKKEPRNDKNLERVQMQEGVEMASWVLSEKKFTK